MENDIAQRLLQRLKEQILVLAEPGVLEQNSAIKEEHPLKGTIRLQDVRDMLKGISESAAETCKKVQDSRSEELEKKKAQESLEKLKAEIESELNKLPAPTVRPESVRNMINRLVKTLP